MNMQAQFSSCGYEANPVAACGSRNYRSDETRLSSKYDRILYFQQDPKLFSRVGELMEASDALVLACSDIHCIELMVQSIDHACCLIDVDLNTNDGLLLVERARSVTRGIPMGCVFSCGSVEEVVRAIRSGADFVVERPFTELRLPNVGVFSSGDFQQKPDQDATNYNLSIAPGLTERERSVAEHVINGLSCKEIARVLNISPRTVEAHRSRIIQKAGARNIVDFVRRALGTSA